MRRWSDIKMICRRNTLSTLLAAGFFLVVSEAPGQMSLLPPSCAELKGDALDKCVRDISVPQPVFRMEQAPPPPPNIAHIPLCEKVIRADEVFCIGRNEIILACLNKSKYPDFNACFEKFIPNIPKPGVADCARAKPGTRNACEARNAVYTKCLGEPLGYFLCLEHNGKLPDNLVRP